MIQPAMVLLTQNDKAVGLQHGKLLKAVILGVPPVFLTSSREIVLYRVNQILKIQAITGTN